MALSIVCLLLAVAIRGLDFVALHPLHDEEFILAAILALAAALIGGCRTIRIIGTAIAVYAVITAFSRHGYYARLDRVRNEFHVFVMRVREVREKVVEYSIDHPTATFPRLSDYVKAGGLSPSDVDFLAGAEVRVFPYLSNGTDKDTFMEIIRGSSRTIVSQVGGVFAYDTNTAGLVETTLEPSGSFRDALEKYQKTNR